MREFKKAQMKLGETDISKVKVDLKSRDEIPKLLLGLQYIYCTPEIKEQVFSILEGEIGKDVNKATGRPGMELWNILVLGTIRLNCNWDYDKLREIANNHRTLRQMVGHGFLDNEEEYALQTLKDNVRLLTPEILEKINEVVVKTGHKLIKKNSEDVIKGKCDSFVVETNVHYPTDINLLFDAIRKVIELITVVCISIGLNGWRQNIHNIRKIRKLFRNAQNRKNSTSKDSKVQEKREKLIKEAHQKYIDLVKSFIKRVKVTIDEIQNNELVGKDKILEIEKYIGHAERQIAQIERRVINEEKIPHEEKVFSIFEEHTEWICKGKAGITQELGLRVCIIEDNSSFIINYKVMEKQTDDKIAVPIIKETKGKYPTLESCSFDKGFYSPANKEELQKILDKVFLPKKGRLSIKDKEEEYLEEFVKTKQKHSAVESAINALENHSLDRCPDHGLDGFKSYVGLAVLARNIQIIGNIIQQKELKRQRKRQMKIKTRENIQNKLAA